MTLAVEVDLDVAEFGTFDRIKEVVARFPGNAPVTVTVTFGEADERALGLTHTADEFDVRLLRALTELPGVSVDY